MADPPWAERGAGKIKRGADKHYPLLKTDEIVAVMLHADAWQVSNDAHLWLWVTNTFLPDGLRVMAALGFRYTSNAVWPKSRAGLGYYMRGKHELCLFGVRGPSERRSKSESTIISDDGFVGRVHSRKPETIYQKCERVSHGPYLEMFARQRRPGWDSWGLEVDTRLIRRLAEKPLPGQLGLFL